MIKNPRTLRSMTRQGFIRWEPAVERHWTGLRVKRFWVEPGERVGPYGVFRYRGRDYQLRYVSGCFHPFVFPVGAKIPSFV